MTGFVEQNLAYWWCIIQCDHIQQ